MIDFFNLKPNIFGLDISDLSIKAVQLRKKKDFLDVFSFGEISLPAGIIKEGEIRDDKILSEKIKELIKKTKPHRLFSKYVIVSLPEEKAFIQVIQMPKLKEEDLKTAIIYEAENYIPFSIEDVYIDFQTIKPVVGGFDHIDVLIAAIPRKTVDVYLNAISNADLIPLVFEIESMSIVRSLVKNEISPFPQLLIDFGAAKTSLIIHSGYSIRFTTSIPVSSNKFTDVISRAMQISFEEAEKMKIESGLKKKEIFEALIPPLTDLVEQIKKYLDYYKTHSSHEHLSQEESGVSKIVLCGGGANLVGLKEFIASECGIPVVLGNPWVNIMSYPPKKIPSIHYKDSLRYTTSIGLALRGINLKLEDLIIK
jgi:type IV pilus assembly protein PilM